MRELLVTSIKPNPINEAIYAPSSIEDLAASIEDLGVLEPLVVDKKRNLISGHRRLAVCIALGLERVPVRVVDISEEELAVTLVSHNQHRVKTAQDILNEVAILKRFYGDRRSVRSNTKIKGKKTRAIMSDKIGVPESTIGKLTYIQKNDSKAIQHIDSGVMSIDQAYKVVRKRLEYDRQLDNNREVKRRVRKRKIIEGKNYKLYTKSSSSMEELEDESIQTVFTSPPFWNLRDYFHKDQIGSEDSFDIYLEAMGEVFSECYRVLSPNGSMFVEMGDNYDNGSLQNNPHRFLLHLLEIDPWTHQNTIIWYKKNTQPRFTKYRYQTSYSFVFFLTKSESGFWDKGSSQVESLSHKRGKDAAPRVSTIRNHAHNKHGVVLAGTTVEAKHKLREDVWVTHTNNYSAKRDVGIDIYHPASFPPQLPEPAILSTTKVGDVVLDPFSGFGSTGVSAIENGRIYVGYEINPRFQDVARLRMNRLGTRKNKSA